MAEPIAEIRTHLEFLGYEVQIVDERGLRAEHPSRMSFVMLQTAGGLLLRSVFGSRTEDVDRLNRLANELNREAAACRFFVDEARDFFLEAWWPPHYERSAFGAFLDVWERDCALLLRTEDARELLA